MDPVFDACLDRHVEQVPQWGNDGENPRYMELKIGSVHGQDKRHRDDDEQHRQLLTVRHAGLGNLRIADVLVEHARMEIVVGGGRQAPVQEHGSQGGNKGRDRHGRLFVKGQRKKIVAV